MAHFSLAAAGLPPVAAVQTPAAHSPAAAHLTHLASSSFTVGEMFCFGRLTAKNQGKKCMISVKIADVFRSPHLWDTDQDGATVTADSGGLFGALRLSLLRNLPQ